jgi:acetyltransferase-like isoleucine patch superfamily enzyme
MREFLFALVEFGVSKLKGKPYKLDRSLDLCYLFGEIARRGLWSLRGFVRLNLFWKGLCFCGPNVQLRGKKYLTINKGVTIERGVLIDGLSREGVSIGKSVSIGAYSIIRPTGVFSDLGVGVKIGDNCGIGPYSYLGAAGGVWIGDNVIMGQHISFHAENHNFEDLTRPIKDQGVTRKGIRVGSDCWIGSNVTFLDGCELGNGCVVGAGSVMVGKYPDCSIIVGVPGKVIKPRK